MRSNSISTTASLDLGKFGMGPGRRADNDAPPRERNNEQSESIEFENGRNQLRGQAELTIENVN